MADLEAKDKITPYQLTLIIIAAAFGAQAVLAPQKLIEEAGTGLILAIVLGGMLFFAAAYLMVKLGMYYPDETLVEYMPRIWGQRLGELVLWWYIAVFIVQCGVILGGFSKAITIFMFDRTPSQVVAMSMLALTVYCVVQEIGTIVRITQITFFVSTAILLGMWAMTILNFRFENLLPFPSNGFTPVLTTVLDTWSMYSGYEIILLLLPLVKCGKPGFVKSVGLSFVILIIIFEMLFVSIIGVVSAKSAENYVYPTVITMRAVELPGTFIERLENYLLLAWVPAVFDTLAMMLYAAAKVITDFYSYKDHRPAVLLFAPIVFAFMVIMQSAQTSLFINNLLSWIGWSFSLGVIPVSMFLAWRQKRGVANVSNEN